MIPASVGFHCPDDVREGNKALRSAAPRTLTGAQMLRRPGAITIAIIVLNVLAYVVQQTSARFTSDYVLYAPAVDAGEYYRLLTAPFLHASITHIAFNMLSLYVLGTQVERYLGGARYIALYVLSALGGSTASYLFLSDNTYGLGASGAVFGLLGALLVIVRRLRLDMNGLLVMLGINLVIGFTVPHIDWRAHLGGLLVGAALTWVFAFSPQEARRWSHPLGAAVIAAVLAVLVLVVA